MQKDWLRGLARDTDPDMMARRDNSGVIATTISEVSRPAIPGIYAPTGSTDNRAHPSRCANASGEEVPEASAGSSRVFPAQIEA